MTYANPAALLAEATKDWTPEERQRFEDDFAHFCAYSGLTPMALGGHYEHDIAFSWAKWGYLCGRGN